jgi:putative endonuclease
MHYVYVLYSGSDHGLYIGYSANLRQRLTEHSNGLARSTSHRRPWRLIYYEAYTESEDALGRERFLKSGTGRSYIKKQCRSFFRRNPLRSTVNSAAIPAVAA